MLVRLLFVPALLAVITFALPQGKVERQLRTSLKNKPFVNIFVKFQGGNAAALQHSSSLLASASRAEKIDNIVESLKFHANLSQVSALDILSGYRFSAVRFKQIWASNEIYVRAATESVIQKLANLSEVEEIREERVVTLETIEHHSSPLATEWNVGKIEADSAWQLPGGNNGQGVVVASIDTGVLRTHEALKNNHRENYGWFDPYDGSNAAQDKDGVGTHTMGITVGAGGIGVAPGAQWIACRGCSAVACSESALKECGQWVLCPTLPNGESPDCSKAPRVVTNPWGGRQGNPFYNGIVAAWRAADIISVFGVGNGGPTCGNVAYAADLADTIGVGATTANDTISSSSAAGPSMTGLIKPDLTAPGSLIRSAWNSNDSAYLTASGTAMAGPHVAGVAALVLSQNPDLTYDQVVRVLRENADTDLPDTGLVCGGIPSTEFPNNQYGYGRLNAKKALQAAINGLFFCNFFPQNF